MNNPTVRMAEAIVPAGQLWIAAFATATGLGAGSATQPPLPEKAVRERTIGAHLNKFIAAKAVFHPDV